MTANLRQSSSSESKRPAASDPVESANAPQNDESDRAGELPMFAVWLSLGFIVLMGLYGLNLGLKARSAAKPSPAKTSAVQPAELVPSLTFEGSRFA